MINYKITPNPLVHEWHIRLTFRQEHDLETEISLPNWVPGSYLIRDFSRHITTIRAFCNGEYAHLTQVKKTGGALPRSPASGKFTTPFTPTTCPSAARF